MSSLPPIGAEGAARLPAAHRLLHFGKYRGKTLDQIPESYLFWLLNEPGTNPAIKQFVAAFLEVDQPEDDIDPDPTSAAVALPGIIFRWGRDMRSEYDDFDPVAEMVVARGLELLQEFCGEYTRRPWAEGGAA